jgi:hypothetical protein
MRQAGPVSRLPDLTDPGQGYHHIVSKTMCARRGVSINPNLVRFIEVPTYGLICFRRLDSYRHVARSVAASLDPFDAPPPRTYTRMLAPRRPGLACRGVI